MGRVMQRAVAAVLQRHMQLQADPMQGCLKHSSRLQQEQVCILSPALTIFWWGASAAESWFTLLANVIGLLRHLALHASIRTHELRLQRNTLGYISALAARVVQRLSISRAPHVDRGGAAQVRQPQAEAVQHREGSAAKHSRMWGHVQPLGECLKTHQSRLELEQAAWILAAQQVPNENLPHP